MGYLDKFFLDKEDWICIAEYENDVVAFLSIEVYRDEGFIYLDDLSVAEGYRNKGIGTTLIYAAEKYAKGIGITKIVFHAQNFQMYLFCQPYPNKNPNFDTS
ncbi:MAG: GNAT family N-acetyltransferase [Eubacterium sp.]|nr:GNAT family N-acetyltransferase [Eubacterium sp.]